MLLRQLLRPNSTEDVNDLQAHYAAVQSEAAYSTAPLAAPMPASPAGASTEGTTANTTNGNAITASPAADAATVSPAPAAPASPALTGI